MSEFPMPVGLDTGVLHVSFELHTGKEHLEVDMFVGLSRGFVSVRVSGEPLWIWAAWHCVVGWLELSACLCVTSELMAEGQLWSPRGLCCTLATSHVLCLVVF